MSKVNIYGANEAVELTKDASILEGQNLHFGQGAGTEDVLVTIAGKADDDAKVRFVYGIDNTQSGAVFVGNQLVSSKILDITTNEVSEPIWNGGVLEGYEVITPATKVTVKWFGKVESADGSVHVGINETVFDIIDTESVKDLIAEASKELQDQIDEIKATHEEDTSRIDASVSAIESFLTEVNIEEAVDGALTVTPSDDPSTFTTYTIGVNVDDETVKVVDDKLAVATYEIKKLAEGDDEYDVNYASQYRLMVTKPGETEAVVAGDVINIMKDFLLKDAHVCTFDKQADGSDMEWGLPGIGGIVYNIGDAVDETHPIYALVDGELEEAPLGKDIKQGHTYLHLILNTKDDDEKDGVVGNDLTTDVYLDFTDIFETFKAGDKFIDVNNGIISLNEDDVVDYVNSSLGVTDKFDEIDASIVDLKAEDASITDALQELDSSFNAYAEATDEHLAVIDASVAELVAEDASIADHLAVTDASVNAIEESYVKTVALSEPSEDNEQFNTLTITKAAKSEAGVIETEDVTVEVANASFYTALNNAIDVLAKNDNYLSNLLTWENLD